MDNQSIDIAEINRNLQESYIHYDPNRVDFTINNYELGQLEQAGNSIWKDIFLSTLGLGIPSIINGCLMFDKLKPEEHLGIDIFINLLIGGICISLSVICLFVWLSNKKSFSKVIEQIKNKPKYKLPSTH